MADKAPAFQFYPRDFLTDERVVMMSNTEVGIYTRLLCYCWLEGTLPLETAALAHMVRMPLKQFTKMWEHSIVRQCFHVGDDGRLHQKRLDEERTKQGSYSRRQSDNAKQRWQAKSDAVALPGACGGIATVMPVASTRQCSAYASSSASASALSLEEEAVGERAGKLLQELYPSWYAKYRNGARLKLVANSLAFEDAKGVCRTWDDGRIEKLARIVLTTDDDWISRTDRSFRVFALKASWADDRLRQVESRTA